MGTVYTVTITPHTLFALADEAARGADGEALLLGALAASEGIGMVLPLVQDGRLRELVRRRGEMHDTVADWQRGHALAVSFGAGGE